MATEADEDRMRPTAEEGCRLLAAFMAVTDPAVRQSIIALVHAMRSDGAATHLPRLLHRRRET